MGQSQSTIERNKQRPVMPTKVFGLIYFQRFYDAVKKSDEEVGKIAWEQKMNFLAAQHFKKEDGWQKEYKELLDEYNKAAESGVGKQKEKPLSKVNEWNKSGKKKFLEKLDCDVEKRKKFIVDYAKTKKAFEKQGMADLHATYNDAQFMYNFLSEKICPNVSDITVMSTKSDFYHLYKKPTYEGDFLTQILDWNINPEGLKDERERFETSIQKTDPTDAKSMSWDKFNKDVLKPSKYRAKHESRKWKKELTAEMKEWFVDLHMKKDENGKNVLLTEGEGELSNKRNELTEKFFKLNIIKDKNEAIFNPGDNEKDKSHPDFIKGLKEEGPVYRFKMEDFWLKGEQERSQRIFKYMHPLIFLPEKLPSFTKIQYNWVFQALTPKEKKEFLQNRIPNWMKPSLENYEGYLQKIKQFHDANEEDEVLSIQTFACHGVVNRGCQCCLLNKHDPSKNFYQMFQVEFQIRNLAKNMPRCYFLTLFACCRESYVDGAKNFGIADNIDVEDAGKENIATRGNVKASKTDPANFTFLFGCNPAEGVKADTQFVKCFVDHCTDLFNPEDGTLMLPEGLGVIDAAKDKVNFESTSCNIGKSLKLKQYDNKVGYKMLLVIRRNEEVDLDENGNIKDGIQANFSKWDDYQKHLREERKNDSKTEINEEVTSTLKLLSELNEEEKKIWEEEKEAFYGEWMCCDRTKLLLKFFKSELRFTNKEILIITEDEARKYEDSLSQSKIFKRYHKPLQKKLNQFAHNIFDGKSSSQQQMLTIILNESDQEDVKDFVVNRNPELGLNILHPDSNLANYDKDKTKQECEEVAKIYTRLLKEKLKSMNQLQFNNLNTFFHHTLGVITFSTRSNKFKHGTGQFNYIYDLKENQDRTVKFRFDFLEKNPLRKFTISKNALGFSLRNPYATSKEQIQWQKNENEVAKEQGREPVKKFDIELKEDLQYDDNDEANNALLVMELLDYNDNSIYKEIKKRTKRIEVDKTRVVNREKILVAYTFYRNDMGDRVEKFREKAIKEVSEARFVIPDLDERDEVICLKKLYHDTTNKIFYFQIVLRAQHSVYIGTLDYKGWTPRADKVKHKNGVRPLKEKQKWYKDNVEGWNPTLGLKIKVTPVQIIKEHIERDPRDEDEDESSLPFRAWPTEMQFHYHEQIEKKKTLTFFVETKNRLLKKFVEFKMKQAIMKKCTKYFDENKSLEDWKLKMSLEDKGLGEKMKDIDEKHKIKVKHNNLNVIAHRDFEDKKLRFYVFNNRMLINGKNSEIEIEVWEWNEDKECDDKDKVTRMEHDVNVIVRRQAHEQTSFKTFKEDQEAKEKQNLEAEWKKKLENLQFLDEIRIDYGKNIDQQVNKAVSRQEKQKQEDLLKEYFLHDNLSKSFKTKENYQQLFEKFKQARDEEDKLKRNKALEIKKKRKQGKYMRGEEDFSSYYDVKPWGDDKVKEEKKKKEDIEEEKKKIEKANKERRKEIDDEIKAEIDEEKKKNLEKKYYARKAPEYEQPEVEYEKFESKRQAGKVTRLFLRYLIQDENGKQAFYTPRIMNFSNEREDTEFWLKQPTVFYQSTDTPERLIFAASTKGNYIFDLKMTKGKLQLYTEKDQREGRAFMWQKVPFAHRLDMIEPEHVSLLQYKKEAKWYKTVQCKLTGLDKKGVETQLTTLPKIVMFPNNNLPAFENSTDDYKKAAMEFEKKIQRDKQKKENEKNKAEKKEKEQKEYNKLSEEQKKVQDKEKEDYAKMNSVQKAAWDKQHNKKHDTTETAVQAGGRTLDDRFVDYNDDQSSDEDENKEKKKKFLIAIAKDSISIVNFSDNFKRGEEFPVVKLNLKTEHDKIEDLFITYQRKKKRITLHYFEKIFHYDGHLKQSTYNQYELSEDFLSMLFSTEELIPNEQSRMIKRIKEIKAPEDRLIDLTVKERAITDLAESLGLTAKEIQKEIDNSDEEEEVKPGQGQPVKSKDEKYKPETAAEFEAYQERMQKLIEKAETFLAKKDKKNKPEESKSAE